MVARTVAVVGRGRMGGAFSRAFRAAGVTFVQRAGRGDAPLRRGLAGRVTWVIAVTDRSIPDVLARALAQGAIARGDTVVHVAGMLGPDVLADARAHGAAVGALHPLVAVAVANDPPPLASRVASFEGDDAAWRAVRAFARPIGLALHRLEGVDRVRYHAAAALVATGSIALAQGAAGLFAGSFDPLRDSQAIGAFVRSLLESAAHNVTATTPSRALASPLVRGDTTTVARHLAAMDGLRETQALYAAALAQVLETSEGLDPDVVRRAKGVLGKVGTR